MNQCVVAVVRRVTYMGKRHCIVEADEGNLVSFITEETGCGTVDLPWLIRVSSGQRINVTMLDFGIAQRDPDFAASNVCKVYAMIYEGGKNGVSVCASDQRLNSVFVSDTSELEIRMVIRKDAGISPGFMISYKAFVSIFHNFLFLIFR